MAPRIPPLPVDDFRVVERQLRLDPVETPLNVITTLAHNPTLYEAWRRFAGALFTGGLDPRDREILILRAAWRCRSSYEWAQHAQIAREVGLSAEEIRRIADQPDSGAWSPADTLLLSAVDELVDERRLSDATWTELSERLGRSELLLLTMLVGHYVMLAGVLASAGVAPESDAKPRLGEA